MTAMNYLHREDRYTTVEQKRMIVEAVGRKYRTSREVAIETGLDPILVKNAMRRMRDAGVLRFAPSKRRDNVREYEVVWWP